MFDKAYLEELAQAIAEWEKNNNKEFNNERQTEFTTEEEEISIRRIYTPVDLANKGYDYMQDVGLPGSYPFTRGISPTMYRGQLWKHTQYAGFATAEETNKLFRKIVEEGGTQAGLSLAFDLPTQLGYDVDYPMAHGEVGKTGIILKSFKDWEKIFEGIDIGKVYTYSVSNAQAIVTMAMHFLLATKQGVDLKMLRGGMQNDILKEYVARGNFIYPIKHAMRLAADTVVYCAENVPFYQPISVGQIHICESGANRVHQAAYTLAIMMAYLDAVVKRGVDIDKVASKVFVMTAQNHTDFFGEIAKLRALRKLWAKIIKERYDAKEPDSMKLVMMTHNGGSYLTREQPLNNIVRSAIACLIGALAGVQHIGLRTMDEVYGIPSTEAEIICIRTQQVIAYETNITNTIDPLGGSYYLETLTKEYEENILKELNRVQELGGMVEAINQGYIQRQIIKDSYKTQQEIESGKRVRVGKNMFCGDEEEITRPTYKADAEVERTQIEELHNLKKTRNNVAVQKALDILKMVAQKEENNENNLLPYVMDAVSVYATMGEICGALREVFGEYTENSPL
jgi:methylmalonyl-CoA mutase N-terminal domain/subunit